MPSNKVRTRFAPSPTGYMHVGNLRTCLLYTSNEGFVHQLQRLLFLQQRPGTGSCLTLQTLFHRLHQGGIGAGGLRRFACCRGGLGILHGLHPVSYTHLWTASCAPLPP